MSPKTKKLKKKKQIIQDKYTLKTHAPEWMSRLKVSDNINLHRSIDCIAKVVPL